MKKTILLLLICIIFMASGCAFPLPHKRLHEYGVKSRVVDDRTNQPLQNVDIVSSSKDEKATRTDSNGNFELPPIFGWHGAYLYGPISFSLLPSFDIPEYERKFIVFAPGYNSLEVEAKDTSINGEYFVIPEIRIKK